MPTLKETNEQLKALVPIVTELAEDVNELDAMVKKLEENSDPATIQEMADTVAAMKAELRKAADVVPETAPPPPDGDEPV